MRILILILGCMYFSTVVRADMLPSKDFIETCTVEKQQKEKESCLSCGDAYFDDVDACKNRYASQGYTKRCKTSGASVWTEIWCKPSVSGVQTSTPSSVKPVGSTAEEKQISTDQAGCQHVRSVESLFSLSVLFGMLVMRRRRLENKDNNIASF
ncbi:MAG: hypothetical protein VX278_05190 [Myxococcota bacterium]|nr:hypothetical protein [Myxococcota bacterium]